MFGVAVELPCRVGEGGSPSKLPRNSNTQRFLWYLLSFGSLYILGVEESIFCFWSHLSKDIFVFCIFPLDGKILYFRKEKKKLYRVWNGKVYKHQVDSNDGKESDNGLEAMILSLGLQEGLNQNRNVLLITTVRRKWTLLPVVRKYYWFNRISRSLNYRSLVEELLYSQQ